MKSIAPILAVLALACGGSSNLSLSVSAGAPAASGARSLTLANGIVLSRIRVVVTKVELELAKSADAGIGDLEEHEMKAGPFLIDLQGTALDSGAPAQVAVASLPAGTYKEIKFKIHKPQATEPGVPADAGLAAMATAGASIVADGTVDGTPFTFSTPMDVEQELEGSFDLAAGGNLTLKMDASSWFTGSGGARLDPRDANNRSQIESAIQKSFKAFRDDDHDGHED